MAGLGDGLSTGDFGGCFVVIGLVWVVWLILWVVFWMVWPNIGFGCSGYLVRWVFLVGVVGVIGWFAIALCGVRRGLG